jgi:hypothetical protein
MRWLHRWAEDLLWAHVRNWVRLYEGRSLESTCRYSHIRMQQSLQVWSRMRQSSRTTRFQGTVINFSKTLKWLFYLQTGCENSWSCPFSAPATVEDGELKLSSQSKRTLSLLNMLEKLFWTRRPREEACSTVSFVKCLPKWIRANLHFITSLRQMLKEGRICLIWISMTRILYTLSMLLILATFLILSIIRYVYRFISLFVELLYLTPSLLVWS